jgi:hypothetical protein
MPAEEEDRANLEPASPAAQAAVAQVEVPGLLPHLARSIPEVVEEEVFIPTLVVMVVPALLSSVMQVRSAAQVES